MRDITSSMLTIDKILGVTKNRTPVGKVYNKSRHSDCFVYILTGEADYYFGEKMMKAEAGNILFLSRHSEYSIDIKHPNYTYYYFDFNFADSDRIDYACNVFKSELLEGLESDYINLYRNWHRGSVADKSSCMATVYKIYSKVIASSIYSYITPSRKNDIDFALEIIQENIHNPDFSVADIAKKLKISEVHFRRLFRMTHNISPMKYVTSQRIEKSKEYLRHNNMPISEIAEKCGFASSYYFSRVFKAETDFTPSEYARNFMG